jgi:site-specific DNA recombinase
MRLAVIYARVSSKDQEREGYSIPAQLKLLREYAERNDFRIVAEFIDVETAKATGRKQFGEMLKFFSGNPQCNVLIVEKTDRLYRNFRDYITLEDLGIEIHLPKEGQVISKDSKSQAKLVHGINVVMARNYIENLREEVRKGMREKAEQGIYPSRPPFGYRNSASGPGIEINPEKAPIAERMFELYASGQHSLSSLRKALKTEFGRDLGKSYLDKLLKNPFYKGQFIWGGKLYPGSHPHLISGETFARVQDIFHGHNKPKYRKHHFAFRGLLTCAYDNCLVTAEIKKGKYTYYRCTGYHGKCDLPYFREEDLANRLGGVLKDIYIPDDVLAQLEKSLTTDKAARERALSHQRQQLQQRLATVRTRLDKAYIDKLEGKITEEFWGRKATEWQSEEQQIKMAMQGLEQIEPDRILDSVRILELANKAYFLYLKQTPAEKAKLLKMVLSNCSIDAVNIHPTYRKPFDLIFTRAKNEEWCGRVDSNHHGIATASPSSWCVCQFRHDRASIW